MYIPPRGKHKKHLKKGANNSAGQFSCLKICFSGIFAASYFDNRGIK